MGAACVRPIQHDGDQSKPYSYQPLRNGRTPSSSSGTANQNLTLTQDGRYVGNQNIKTVTIQEQQLKQQQQQQRELQQQQQREQQQREQQEQLRLQQQQQREQQEQLRLQQQQQREQLEQLQLQQQQQRLEQEQLQQEQQRLQQNQPQEQQFQPVTDARSLNQINELSHNLTTDRVPAPDCHNETQVDSLKELKRCDSLIEDDNYCPTCFYGYEMDNPKIPTKCHHHYHLACILEWMERSNKCPACGQEMIILPM